MAEAPGSRSAPESPAAAASPAAAEGSSTAESTQPGRRSRIGWLCPKCRADYPPGHAAGTDGVRRCPADGWAVVAPSALDDADNDPFLGATVVGRFVIQARLGSGSMGMVYRARQIGMDRDVAVKILRSDRAFDAQAKARFSREARAMSLLTSPHTVTVFDFGEIPDDGREGEASAGAGSLYLAMELLEGESLGQRLRVRRRLKVDEALRITRHALSSLAEAHDKGIIHRDLKPDNLFLTRTSEGESCKVLDFGIAKVVSDNHGSVDAAETQAGTVFGTPRYMSPEQAQAKPLDARSDLYSLGVLLYQMLSGRPPFVDDDAVVVMARHIKSMPEPPALVAPDAAIPDELSALVIRALAKDPADRPQSARAFAEALEVAAATVARPGRVPSTPPVLSSGELSAVVADDLDVLPRGTSERPRPQRDRRRAVALAGVALLAVALLALGLAGRRSGGAAADGATAQGAPAGVEPGAAAEVPQPPAADRAGSMSAAPGASAPPSATAGASASAPADRSAPSGAAPRRPSPKKPYVRFE